jgi:hypothetical protein
MASPETDHSKATRLPSMRSLVVFVMSNKAIAVRNIGFVLFAHSANMRYPFQRYDGIELRMLPVSSTPSILHHGTEFYGQPCGSEILFSTAPTRKKQIQQVSYWLEIGFWRYVVAF